MWKDKVKNILWFLFVYTPLVTANGLGCIILANEKIVGGSFQVVTFRKTKRQIDKEKFGTIQNVTDKEAYTSSYHVNKNEDIELQKKLLFESEFQKLSLGGGVSQLDASNIKDDEETEDLVRFIYNNVQCIEYIG